ncbi:MAG TPA: hypothetical protein DCM86_12170 [Verrucomicrobiales bacterium]|nr:hypothetical protein [Verrucomicrobiales bacterium]
MIPGGLAALAGALLTGRGDWHRRAAYFAFFGALGWSFGGSISYMMVIAYTHSGHSPSVLYGFASLFLIGFLWAAMGGAGTALPIFLSGAELVELFPPLTAVFAGWELQDRVIERWFSGGSEFRHQSPLYWYDTDWVAALVAVLAVGVLAGVRRRWDRGSSLILHMALGWWAGFLVLVPWLGLRMTPPRGDNWSGCLGMVAGMWVFFQRRGLPGLTWASLLCGLFGGFGFATAAFLKLAGMTSGWQTNWHSVLEQTYGFLNGLGVAALFLWLAPRAPRLEETPPARCWTHYYAGGFLLLVVTYLNLVKNVPVWVEAKAIPAVMGGMAAATWFNLAYGLAAGAFLLLAWNHARGGVEVTLLPSTPRGRGELLYLLFLWCMVIGNFERALVSFTPQRLVTEGVVFLNAILCTVGLILVRRPAPAPPPPGGIAWGGVLRRTAWVGMAAALLVTGLEWGGTRLIYGDRPAANARPQVRFGPGSPVDHPKSGEPHP